MVMKIVSFVISDEMLVQLKAFAVKEGRNQSDSIRVLLGKGLVCNDGKCHYKQVLESEANVLGLDEGLDGGQVGERKTDC